VADFIPVIGEVLATDFSSDYYQHVHNKLHHLTTE